MVKTRSDVADLKGTEKFCLQKNPIACTSNSSKDKVSLIFKSPLFSSAWEGVDLLLPVFEGVYSPQTQTC